MPGVQRCIVGYSGGTELNPTYAAMKDHTESVLVEFDANQISYERILQKWIQLSAPYEIKLQYRTAVFYLNAQQESVARAMCDDWNQDFVDVEKATRFYMAEERHQNFLDRL